MAGNSIRPRRPLSAVASWVCKALFWALCYVGAPGAVEEAVVRIESATGGHLRSGSGFFVRIEDHVAYVVTAAHVVEGDPHPKLYFRDPPHHATTARVLALEGGEPQGLALLLVESGLPKAIIALPMAEDGGDTLGSGESVTALGVPAGLRTWAVIQGNVVSWKNRNILFSGGVDEGNSGGPLLKGAAVVGLVMGVEGHFGLAVPALSVNIFLKSNRVAWVTAPQVGTDRPATLSRPLTSISARPDTNTTFRDCPECPEMVAIPTGSFRMGSSSAANLLPVHTVAFTQAFAIAKSETTFEQWDTCVRDKDCRQDVPDAGWGRGLRPVINVSWDDTQDYLRWLSRKTGQSYRLPSEAEWEYAARAGTITNRFWGDESDDACRYANVHDETSKRQNGFSWSYHECDDGYAQTAPVGSFRANGFGLDDMLGNVWEWTEDCWSDSYEDAPQDGSARMLADCAWHVFRGGSWNDGPGSLGSAYRGRGRTADRMILLGFRPARFL